MKICFVSSSGGHWEELMCLKEIAEKYDSFYVTERGGQAKDSKLDKMYLLSQINRKEKLFVFHFIWIFVRALFILLKEKPDVIITTGALVSFPFCRIGKWMKRKIIYIESFARVNTASKTGEMVYPFADLFIVQWEELKKVYPKAIYSGGIF